MTSLGIVTAAGAAERFGSQKLLANVGGSPLLERTVRSLLDGGVDRIVVVLAPEDAGIRREVPALSDSRVAALTNRHPERGMFSSIQEAVRDHTGDPLLVLPGDMPYVEPATVAALLAKHQETKGIVSPRFHGKRGHPVIIPGKYRAEIRDADEKLTLHEILRAHAGERVDMDVYDRGVVRDIDVPADLGEAAP